MTALGEVLVGMLVGAGQNAASFLLSLFLMLYLLFFLLRDGRAIGLAVFGAVPLTAEQKERLFTKLADVSRATLKGTVVVGLVQGALGGLAFAMLGISAPLFWGRGDGGAVRAAASGHGAGLAACGGGIDDAGRLGRGADADALRRAGDLELRQYPAPHRRGARHRMPDYLVLFTTVGGLGLFGISGLVLGPVLAGLTLVSWQLVAETHAAPAPGDDGPAVRG